MIRLFIVADVRLYREGLAELLGRDGAFRLCATAASRAEALEKLPEYPADVVLVDMVMPEALETLCAILARAPDVKVVALAIGEVGTDVIACAEAGAVAYVSRDGSFKDLVAAIHGAARGEA